jgi:formylglycine-generating enzyme required for sulfatase activity
VIVTVQVWTGREVRALREAKRMSIRMFAETLGVSERAISKWESAGGAVQPRPVNQHALDSVLAASGADVHTRFSTRLAQPAGEVSGTVSVEQSSPSSGYLSTAEQHFVRHPVDGKLMALVEAGTFLAGTEDEPVWLGAFYIDVFPTTNADYARFVQATHHNSPQHWPSGKQLGAELDDHPVVYVTWNDATAYSSWCAKSLPEAPQWEKAARGTRGDTYPWGRQATPAKCNVREGNIGTTTPVGKYHSGASPYGVYDLCGNVWEWCATETTPDRHELKGSAFTSPFLRCTPSAFNDADRTMLDDDTGFRCVTPVETLHALLKL